MPATLASGDAPAGTGANAVPGPVAQIRCRAPPCHLAPVILPECGRDRPALLDGHLIAIHGKLP